MSGPCDFPPPRARGSRLEVPGQKTWTPPLWAYAAQQQQWGTPTASLAPPGYTWTYEWKSATFDLRPDLASRIGQLKEGYAIQDTAARLYVLLTGLDGGTFNASGMEVYAQNFVQVFNAAPQTAAPGGSGAAAPDLVGLGLTNVSSDFYPSGTSGVGRAAAVFSPPGTAAGGGEGYPIRYWQIRLLFQYFVASVLPLPTPVPPNTIVLTAGMF